MSYQNILVETNDRVCVITINREAKLNALNKDTLAELHTAFEAAFADAQVGGIILTGAGKKAFVAGADISELTELNTYSATAMATGVHDDVMNLIENGPKPVIAAINGYALGGGLELAMAAHIRIAADNAKVGLPEVTLGLIPGYGGTQRLTALVGKGKALEMILTADAIDAPTAQTIGLVNQVVPADELLPKSEEILRKILSRAPLAVANAITAINAAGTTDGYATEISGFAGCFNTTDTREGIAAFLEKRKPVFTGK
ncbi:enoyl-CoA hydratase/isomerase family protein [Mucilaginibacter ginkgonis]|uniref:Enoyl-CoA hydratase/isomerase family protein n=2 Tax=Mucilaginibacter ginkgonis TaxID=2682091 RepID=A0A6I4HZ16_9SPHI|nr:enoyl-CoA hydratase/isomerase family protein [Mucilaginibacter ginkgonis]